MDICITHSKSYRRKYYHRRSTSTSNAIDQNSGVNRKGPYQPHKVRKKGYQETEK